LQGRKARCVRLFLNTAASHNTCQASDPALSVHANPQPLLRGPM
jgi:hypothetical protein